MLWTITVVLFAFWLIGFVSFPMLGAWIHLLLVLMVVSVLLNLFVFGRGPAHR